MRKVVLIVAIILLGATAIAAQEKKKSLTMDDVEPAAPKSSEPAARSKSTSSRSSRSSRSAKGTTTAAPGTDDERRWQDEYTHAQLDVENLKLRSAIDEHDANLKLDLQNKQAAVADLKAEGKQKKFQEGPSVDLDYRERYVKLRMQMIKEERLHPQKAAREEEKTIYVQSDRPRDAKRRRMSVPLTEKRVIAPKETKLDRMQLQLQDLIEEGRHAGASPSMFRD